MSQESFIDAVMSRKIANQGDEMNEPAICVSIVAEKARADEVAELLTEMAALAVEDEGCTIFSAHRSQRNPHVFVVYETYVDKAAHERHMASEELRAINGRVRELCVSLDIVAGSVVAGGVTARA
ncbi:putative quinol monooxygenase [Pseudonocardia ailaonensis]|uniref:putative quinol monooxygenase n=1 Tax=Pseudonocardia ailaonensis TaxID=367279 RepID=UPI0031DBE19D